ncbi:MAG: glycosyltransferase [Halanaerobiales bacterium]|nr:glycosyltransferase [Halanaerobiales bacterium]
MEKNSNLSILVPNLGNSLLFSKKLLIRELAEKYDAKIFVLSGNQNDTDFFDEERVIFLNMEITSSFIKIPVNYYNNINELKDLKKKYRINRSISFGKKANILNVLSRTGEEIILNVEETYDDSFVLEKFIKNMYKKAEKIVVGTKRKQDYIIAQYKFKKENVFIMEDILPIDQISEEAAAEIDDNLKEFFENKVLINYGNLTEDNGQWHLIKAFFRIKEKFDDVKLLILGEGPLYEELNNLINSMNMEEDINIINKFNNPYKYLIRSDIFVLSSHHEEGKDRVLDAMACARPIISTTSSDEIINLLSPTNYVKNINEPFLAEYGILVPVATNSLNTSSKVLNKKEVILSSAIFKLLNDYEIYDEYMEQAAKRAVDYSAENIVNKWVEALEK